MIKQNKVPPIRKGEKVYFVYNDKKTGIRLGRVYGEVIKVNPVNMRIREDLGYAYKYWTVYKNYVRRDTAK